MKYASVVVPVMRLATLFWNEAPVPTLPSTLSDERNAGLNGSHRFAGCAGISGRNAGMAVVPAASEPLRPIQPATPETRRVRRAAFGRNQSLQTTEAQRTQRKYELVLGLPARCKSG